MDKYLCIDTNIFLQCGLLEIEGDDIDALNKLIELLDSDSLKLLLPEIIELEFLRMIDQKFDTMVSQINMHKASINKDASLDAKVKSDMIEKLDEVIHSRSENIDNVKQKIQNIFTHENTVKDSLKITPQALVDGYRLYLVGAKPYKHSKNAAGIQSDCLIICLLKDFFADKSDYELYFCTNNKSDFAEETSGPTSPDSPAMHPDIARHFNHIEYRSNLFTLLNEKFGTTYPQESIEKLKEKEGLLEIVDMEPLDSLSSSKNGADDSFGDSDTAESSYSVGKN